MFSAQDLIYDLIDGVKLDERCFIPVGRSLEPYKSIGENRNKPRAESIRADLAMDLHYRAQKRVQRPVPGLTVLANPREHSGVRCSY